MRSSLLLTVALTSGFLSLTFTACGTANRCSATTCPTGCCDSSGLCQTTGSSSACGSRGAACAVCGVTASCVAGSCMQNISGSGGSGVGGGSSGVGGGSSSTGGGSSSTGGGSPGVGGGSSGVGGGSSSTGGGSSGGGSAGGSSSTGGGSSGGGSAGGDAVAFCTRLNAAMNRFFAGRTVCGSGGITLTNTYDASTCLSGYASCSMGDKQTLTAGTGCIEMATICSAGNDTAAINSIGPCFNILTDISPACSAVLGGE
ncbi:MAG: hypothetical protein Q8S33_19650 [Myxococcales bacterium]|nr:hypothetical protein [Myxococcales bacterium]